MTRHPNWHIELDEFLRQHQSLPFVWGANDCCLFAANAVKSITGIDIADDFRDKYTDQASAFALIEHVTGGTSVTDAVLYCAGKHGLTKWPYPLQAQRGDLCAVGNDGNIIAGIIDLSGRYVAAMGDSGIVRLPLSAIVRAWHV